MNSHAGKEVIAIFLSESCETRALDNCLDNLYKHDLAACDIYETVLQNISNEEIKSRVNGFFQEHREHIDDLAQIIEDEKGEQPSDARSLKGIILGIYTQLWSMTGQSGALKALKTSQNIVLDQYKKAIPFLINCDDKTRSLIRKFIQNEQKHYDYLDSLKI